MKKVTKFVLALTLVASAGSVMTSCGGGDDDPIDNPVVNPVKPDDGTGNGGNNNGGGSSANLDARQQMLLGTWKCTMSSTDYTVITFNADGTSDWIVKTDDDKDKFSLTYQLGELYLSFTEEDGTTNYTYRLTQTTLTFDGDEYLRIDNYIEEDEPEDQPQAADTNYANRGASARTFRGSGTKADPYVISDATELRKLADDVEGGKTYRDEYFKMTADIIINRNVLTANGALNGNGSSFEQWKPIGKGTTPFCGTFDGNGHTISGIYINKEERDSLGLFGFFSGTLTNLTVKDSYVKGRRNIGGVVGIAVASKYSKTYSPSIAQCLHYGSVCGIKTSVSSKKSVYVGGIVGDLVDGKITKCLNDGTVEGARYVGGIGGGIKNSTLSDCLVYGKISAYESYTAGICGYFADSTVSKTLYNCCNFAEIDAENCSGIVHACGGKLSNVINYGKVTDASTPYAIVSSLRGTAAKKATCTNLYYIETSAANGAYGGTSRSTITNCLSMTEKEMKAQTFLNTLNANAKALGSSYSQWKFGNDGFPVLSWIE